MHTILFIFSTIALITALASAMPQQLTLSLVPPPPIQQNFVSPPRNNAINPSVSKRNNRQRFESDLNYCRLKYRIIENRTQLLLLILLLNYYSILLQSVTMAVYYFPSILLVMCIYVIYLIKKQKVSFNF